MVTQVISGTTVGIDGYKIIVETDIAGGIPSIAMVGLPDTAINEAREGIFNKEGGPFGSVIVKDGKIVGRGHNRVVKNNDPTCHGEVSAIRNACENLGTFDLSGCEIYTTGEPCQMCLTACLWANLDKVYYGCTIEDNSVIGFRDEKFDNIFTGREKLGDFLEEVDRDACLQLFEEYKKLDKTMY